VRLAAKLTGWRIDIKSEEEKRREVEAQFGALEVGEGDGTSAPAASGAEASEPGESATTDESAEVNREEQA
jgi:N utilization substance protein A